MLKRCEIDVFKCADIDDFHSLALSVISARIALHTTYFAELVQDLVCIEPVIREFIFTGYKCEVFSFGHREEESFPRTDGAIALHHGLREIEIRGVSHCATLATTRILSHDEKF